MATQHDAADLYTSLQERAANDQAQLTAERLQLAEMRAARETRRELEAAQAQADEDALHAMGVVVWALAGLAVFLVVVVWATWLWAHGW